MVRFLIKAALESEALIKGSAALIWEPMLIGGNAVKLTLLSIVSKIQNKSHKCCISRFFLKTDIIAVGKFTSVNNVFNFQTASSVQLSNS